MSTYSTLYITRAKAIETIFGQEFTDEQLAEMMDAILRDRLYNCRIVNNEFPVNDDEVI